MTSKSIATLSAFGVVKNYDEQGVINIRAVWDERKPNLLWEEPPFIFLGSPATLCNLDLARTPHDYIAFSAVGDLPDWFYRLKKPEDMLP